MIIFVDDRLNNLYIGVQNDFFDPTFDVNDWQYCVEDASPVFMGETRYFYCTPQKRGRYVSLSLRRSGILTVCEVEIYAKYGK